MNAPRGRIIDEPDREMTRLTTDLDVDICIVGGGLAGLGIAIETARRGASVAVLEADRLGIGASGHHLGTVKAGFDVSLDHLIARVGVQDARELWRMSLAGAEDVRAWATPMPDIALTPGVLEVSNVDDGERLAARLDRLDDFGIETALWPVEQVRESLKTERYFQALYYPNAFQLDASAYFKGLRSAALQAGVRIYEDTAATAVDASGVRKRVTTPAARVRAGHVVLAGNTSLGRAHPRLAATLLPIWRYASVTEPLGERLGEAIAFPGSVIDADGVDHFRIVGGDRLMWSCPTTTWAGRPARYAGAIGRVRTVFPRLGKFRIDESWGAATGHTVHGMPQIGQLQPGLWVASGFGRQGINTAAMAASLISRGVLWRDDSWRLMSSFDLVWAGGRTGRIAGQVVEVAKRWRSDTAGAFARRREKIARRAATPQQVTDVSAGSEPPATTSQQSERPAATGA